jgi:hypothetical protein
MRKVVTALVVLGLGSSGRASGANERSQTTTTTTTERNAGGAKTTIETRWKTEGATGETAHGVKTTTEKHIKPDGNAETIKRVETTHKRPDSRRAHTTDVEETTVRDAQGIVVSYAKDVK